MILSAAASSAVRARPMGPQLAPSRRPAQGPAAVSTARSQASSAHRMEVTATGMRGGSLAQAQKPPPPPQVDENNEVVAILKDAGLHMYAMALLQSGFDDVETLLSIEDSDMKDLGIPSYHAVRLRRKLQDLQREAAKPEPEVDPSNPVAIFLNEVGLGQYAQIFVLSGFDEMETLILIDDPDLKELGVPRGHAVKLKKRLREYELQQASREDRRTARRPPPGPRRPATAQQAGRGPEPGGRQPGPPAVSSSAVASEKVRSAVEQSWEQVQAIGSYAVGELLYKYTFELAPEAVELFPPEVRFKYRDWTEDEGGDEEDIWESPALRKLFGKVVNAVGCTVAGLHDMGKLVPMLTKLGMRHINYGVSEPHWVVLGKALDLTLRDILGAAYTHEVQSSWSMVYSFMSSIMIDGLHQAQEIVRLGRQGPKSIADDAASQCSSMPARCTGSDAGDICASPCPSAASTRLQEEYSLSSLGGSAS